MTLKRKDEGEKEGQNKIKEFLEEMGYWRKGRKSKNLKLSNKEKINDPKCGNWKILELQCPKGYLFKKAGIHQSKRWEINGKQKKDNVVQE